MKFIFSISIFLGLVLSLNAQNQQKDTTKAKQVNLNEVIVSASRANDKIPVTYSNLKKEDIEKVNLGQDIPILLNYLPSVVSTTFDGTGIGYTDIRIRGADNSRINVTINGIPYNDADSQTTFFVNLQDFASSIENIQVQRGVGTSTNGAGAFGASINILTDNYSEDAFGQISNSFGSFSSRKHTVRFGTGLINDHFAFSGRLSSIESNGYVDRAFSDLSSYFLDGIYKDENTLIKALIFGGNERTGLSFVGLTEEQLQEDRRANFDGQFFDRDGNEQFHENQTDNFRQDHYQLHITQEFDSFWTGNLSFHYTDNRGFFEQFIDDTIFLAFNGIPNLEFYRLEPFQANGVLVESADLITRSHIVADFYGTVFNLNYTKDDLNLIFGGAVNRYDGGQFGEVIASDFAIIPQNPFRFFENETDKWDTNVYAKATYNLNKNISLYGDLQLRNVSYTANGTLFEPGALLDVDENYTFFNPKAGLTYRLDSGNSFYLSYARANREPARVDFENGNPEPESLNDFELGWRHLSQDFQLNANVYYLDFNNQLVLTGALDEVGFPIRQNSGSSFRLGLELDANWNISKKFSVQPNVALSTNKNRDFVFQRDGELQNLGNTNISFSPEIVVGNVFTYKATDALSFAFYSKYVGEQYLGNIDSDVSLIDSYFVSDLGIQYTLKNLGIVKSIVFNGQVNNVFDLEYENNGFFFTFDDDFSNPGTVTTIEGNGFYAQAGINFLLGATVNF